MGSINIIPAQLLGMDRYWKGFLPEPSVRTVGDMECVLADPDSVELDSATPLYYMYRDLAMNETDREILSRQNIRYDITVIPPMVLSGEYVKTKGHYHPEDPAGLGYPELYQVLAGEAHFLLQQKGLLDVVAVAASAGECVLIPPGYGHVSINSGEEVLVMANLVSTLFDSEYAVYEEMQGGAYYAQEKEGDENPNGINWNQNPRYVSAAPIREIAARDIPEQGILHGTVFRHGMEIYDLVSGSADLSFLNEPKRFV
ncbi:glucose-6-phosphate isomerase [Methanogenium marinum]|uniref:glucose-6-phosphate isomerase n=1 Tax=Methanogenium marinum TaxID=348610 RepID=A0A9Q4PXN7_9EURY|nr:glucose-6-phosphate isomerase family protein [Methanogenium marinum]MDE4907318.1 glucose-6-phosphate isomerase [Methanogenium marinum]